MASSFFKTPLVNSRVSLPPLDYIHLYIFVSLSFSFFVSLSAYSVLPLDRFTPLLDCLQVAFNTLMDDGELDFSNLEMFSSSNIPDLPTSSLDSFSFMDEFLNDTLACTHTHTCNQPGPDNSHTHTCYHVHTKIVPGPSDDMAESGEKVSKKRSSSSSGNKEAVRKYREKKKAKAASLEEEVVRLRALNQHLVKKLQSQAVMEAEIARLKCLLVDIRGRIEGEIGSFPYQKPNQGYNNLTPGSYMMNPCNLQGTELNGQCFNDCVQNQNSLLDCGLGKGVPNASTSNGDTRKAAN